MRQLRLPHAMRSAFLVALGAALIGASVALDIGAAALVSAVIVGAITVALGLAGTAPEGRGTLPSRALASYDMGLALGLLLGAIAFAAAGIPGGLALFGVAGLAVLTVSVTTRYGHRHA